MSVSIRQQIISAWAETLRATGAFKHVEDAEPYNYATVALPACWVVEGNETIDHAKLFGKAECDLSVIVQVVYRFDSKNPAQSLYRVGREYLALLQESVMGNLQWNGLAILTLEQGNAMGQLDTDTHAFGVLTTEWVVRYRRATLDPTQR